MACDSDEEEEDEEDENEGGSGEEEEDSEEEAEVGSGEWGSEEEGPVSGEEPAVCVGKVVLNHKLYTCLASCFCSACQLRQYDGCYTHSMYPGLVPNFEVGVVQETVVMDTGVAPAGDGKEPAKIVFGKREKVCVMERITGTQAGDSYCSRT